MNLQQNCNVQATTLSRDRLGWLLCMEAASDTPAVGRKRGREDTA